jgi:hypothetical protein
MKQTDRFSLSFALLLIPLLFSLSCLRPQAPQYPTPDTMQDLLLEEPILPPVELPIPDTPKADPTLSRTLWASPYLIFQASYGEKISDHYLMALDTLQGKLTLIHKGHHARFWVEENKLLFQHIDRFYECPLSEFRWIKAKATPDEVSIRKLFRYPLQSEIPEFLHPVEWSNLHQVLEGSFTKAGQKELLFISGRKEGYFFALYSMSPQAFQLLWSDQLQREMPPGYGPELMFNFQQVLAHDFDQDGAQEVLIHGEYEGMTSLVDGLVVLRLSHPQKEQKIQLLPDPGYQDKSSTKGRLHRLSSSKIQWILERELSQREVFTLSFQEERGLLLGKAQIHPISHPESQQLRHQDFYFTGQNLHRARELKKLQSQRLPSLLLPPLYDPSDPILSPEEAEYHTLRQQGLELFVARLDQGWNPLEAYPKDKLKDYYSDNPKDFIDFPKSWKRCFDLIPVKTQGTLSYVLVQGFTYSYVSRGSSEEYFAYLYSLDLFDEGFHRLIDSRLESFFMHESMMGTEGLSPEILQLEVSKADYLKPTENTSILLPLPGQNVLWLIQPLYRSHESYELIRIQSDGFHLVKEGASTSKSFLKYALSPAIEMFYWNRYVGTAWGDEGWIGWIDIADPISGGLISQCFLIRYQREMEKAYRNYHFYRYRHKPPSHPDELLEGFQIDLLEAYEQIIYYGRQDRLEQLRKENF